MLSWLLVNIGVGGEPQLSHKLEKLRDYCRTDSRFPGERTSILFSHTEKTRTPPSDPQGPEFSPMRRRCLPMK